MMLRTLALASLSLLGLACAGDPPPDVEPRTEVDATIQNHIGQIFSAHDADGNGALSKEEATTNPWLVAHFDEADLDADGQVTPEEAAQLAHDVHAAHCEDGECEPHGSMQEHVQQAFASMDADGDQLVTAEEAEGHHLEHVFAQVDADRDGRVSATELESFAQTMHGGPAGAHGGPRDHD